jgi:hypothetical protein
MTDLSISAAKLIKFMENLKMVIRGDAEICFISNAA